MTGPEFITLIEMLVRDGRFTEARALALLHSGAVFPQLAADEFVYLTSLLEVVDRVADAIDATSDTASTQAIRTPSRAAEGL